MQKAEIVLSILNQKSAKDGNYVFDRLYRYLFNKDLYLNAYAKIYAKPGNMTEGVDGQTIDGFNLQLIENLIEKLKHEQYYPKPVKRTYILKKNGKKRPLGIPSFEDKLLQEVMRQILEAIYEPVFSDNSHGFRPDRSCHTALIQIKQKATGTNWVIEGDVTGCFDNIDHDILIDILSKKIKDGRFIELITRFLKAGYYEFRKVHNTLSGCPQGNTISPILSNIYLSEFDSYMEQLTRKYHNGGRKKASKEYNRLVNKRRTALNHRDFELAKSILKEMREIPSQDEMDANFIRINYVRYADDFVICVTGNKFLATSIKSDVSEFLKQNLNLELNAEKTVITNLKEGRTRFLGYEFTKSYCNTKITENTKGVERRSINGLIQLLVPADVINEKIRIFSQKNKPAAFTARINQPVLDIISDFNAEMRGLYNYYCLATDVSTKLYKFKFYHYYSLAKTIARKERTTVKKVIKKYGVSVPRKSGTGTRNIIGATYETKVGKKTVTYFNDSIKKQDKARADVKDTFGRGFGYNSQLVIRLNAKICELCGSNENIEVHHVRKLKDIKDKYKKRGGIIPNWVLAMSKMNRKTLVVCRKCHDNIHEGKI